MPWATHWVSWVLQTNCTGEANPRLAGSPGGLVALALTIGIGAGVAAPHGHRLEARLRKVGDERVAESNQRSLEAVIQRERGTHTTVGHEDRHRAALKKR